MKLIENSFIPNYFQLPSTASKTIIIESEDDYKEIDINYPHIVIGEGSNLILPEFINAQIIKLGFKEINHQNTTIEVSGAVTWAELIDYSLKNNLYGLENLTAIPGLATAAPVQNIGAYGVQISEFIQSVVCWDLESNKFIHLSNDDCAFSYRRSLFQSNKSLIIHKVCLQLNDTFKPNLTYKSIQEFLMKNSINGEDLSPAKLSSVIADIRSQRLPNPQLFPNVGSFFKNPTISSDTFHQLHGNYPEIPHWSDEHGFKISAGWLISMISNELESNNLELFVNNNLVIINEGCTYEELLKFVSSIQSKVSTKFGIKLEVEPEIIT